MISRTVGHLDLKLFENHGELWFLCIVSSLSALLPPLEKARVVVSAHFHSVNTPDTAGLELAIGHRNVVLSGDEQH